VKLEKPRSYTVFRWPTLTSAPLRPTDEPTSFFAEGNEVSGTQWHERSHTAIQKDKTTGRQTDRSRIRDRRRHAERHRDICRNRDKL